MKKRLFYEEDEREFYWVTETPKQIKIDWVEKLQTDGTPLDQNVRWKNLVVNKEKNRKHCLSLFEEDVICVYPFQAGQPFYLTLAVAEDFDKEILDCKSWGVSADYYQKLASNLTPLPQSQGGKEEE